MGLYLISFIMLVFGIIGIYGFMADGGANADALEIFETLGGASVMMMGLAAIVFLFLGYACYKNGSKFVMIIFLSLAFFSGLYSAAAGNADEPGMYLMFVVVAIFLIIYGLVALLSKSGYMLTLLLIFAGLVFLFFGLANNATDGTTYLLILGIFALLSFILALWLALADTAGVDIPVF